MRSRLMMCRCCMGLLLLAACSGPEANMQSGDPYERYLGVKELEGEDDADSVAAIVKALEDEHYLVVLGALEIIAADGRPEFVQHVAPMTKHKEAWVRRQACLTLATLGSEEGIPDLLAALGDADPNVRREAAKALATCGQRPEVLGALVEAVADKDASVAFMAHEGLRKITGREDVSRSREAWAEALK